MSFQLWTIQAREGFAVGGEVIELADENGALIDLTDLGVTMRMTGWHREEEFSIASGNFTLVPPVLPAIYSTAWLFTMTVEDVAELKVGNNQFEVLISDGNNVLVGEIAGVIEKRKP